MAVVLSLSACESSQEKTAELNKLAKEHPVAQVEQGLSIKSASHQVRVLATALVANSEAAAAVVTVKNTGSTALADIPIEITVHGAQGEALYANTVPGLSTALVSIALLRPAEQFTWVDDQVQLPGGQGANAGGDTVSAMLGSVPALTQSPASVPALRVSSTRIAQTAEVGEAIEGTVTNPSAVAQTELVLYGVARRGARVVAAGRAQLPQLAAGASSSFQIPLIGSAKGATVQVGVPPTTL